MAKDRKKLIHIHSSIPDKQPTPQSLEVGEIAVNNAANQEFLSIKNSEDKVKRFSSDEQLITWMEKKEVMPYVGYVRGGAGPSATSAATPTADNYGSYGILESDLSGNTSEIVIKLNQVAASATTKHERVNGSKDRYEKDVNPTTDSGVNDGAGFFIDMSRYAMQGANPTFSGITNTCYTNLNGTTKIKGVNGACGSLLDITVNSAKTDVETANTEITSATTVIGTNTTTISGNTTLSVSGTTTETKKGKVTETNLADKQESTSGNSYNDVKLAYSGTTGGTTTEIKVGNVTESHSGTTTENKKGDVTENNLANKTENTTGNVVENTTGTTTIMRNGVVSEDNKNNVVRTTSGTTTETFKGQVTENNQSGYTVNTTGNVITNTTGTTTELHNGQVTITNNSGLTETTKGNVVENVSGTTTINHSGTTTTNVSANTVFNTTGTTTINSTGSTTIQSTGDNSDVTIYAKDDLCATSDDVAAFKGANTTNIGSDCTNANQTKTLNVRANSADTRVTSAYTSATTATTIIGTANTSATTADYSGNTLSSHVKGLTHSGDTLNVTESTSATIKSPTTTISGCTKIDLVSDDLNFKSCTSAGTIDFDFCNGFNVNSNAVKFEQCSTAGTFTIKEKGTSISGETLTIRESGATDFSGNTLTTTTAGNTNINVKGNLTEAVTGNTNVTVSGSTIIKSEDGTTIQTTAGNTNINTTGNTNITSTGTTTLSSSGITTIEATGANSDVCISATDSARVYGKGSTYVGVNCAGTAGSATTVEGTTLVLSGNTTNISGATTLNLSGKTVNVDATDIDVDASNNYCVSAATKANIYGKATNIGIECGGTTATSVNVSGTTINEGGTTLNQNFQDYDINASKTYCVSAATNANFYGKTTNVGVDCGGTTATTINVSGTTINEGGTTNNNNFTTINNTATTINNKANFNITGTTYISGNTTISGDVTIGDELIIPIPCDSISSTTVNKALCEILDRGEVSWKVGDYAATDENLKWYELWQNGAQIKDQNGNAVRIDIPKDHILKDVSIVYGKANGSSFTACTSTATDCHWYIKLVWNVFNPSTGHSDDKTVYLPVDDFIKDIDDKNPTDTGTAANHNVVVDVWYDGKQNWVSASTTPTMHVTNMYATNAVSGATVSGTSTSAGTLTVTGNTTLKGTTATTLSATSVSATTFYGKMSKDLSFSTGTTSVETPYNGSAAKSVTIASDVKHLYRNQLKVDYGSSVSSSNDFTYDPGAGTVNTSGNTRLDTITIPTSVKNLSNWNGSCYEFDAPLCVTGTITASGAIYSSDKNLKENINRINYEDLDKVALIEEKSFNFKDDDDKRKVYGVIAQDVQEAGLDELVHVKEDGMLGVDYTSFLVLKVAKLTQDNNALTALVVNLDQRVRELENKLNNKD